MQIVCPATSPPTGVLSALPGSERPVRIDDVQPLLEVLLEQWSRVLADVSIEPRTSGVPAIICKPYKDIGFSCCDVSHEHSKRLLVRKDDFHTLSDLKGVEARLSCGGTMLRLAAERPDLQVRWVVFASSPQRAAEARASAADFLAGFRNWRLVVHEFRDGYLPYTGAEVKDAFEALKDYAPDIIFTHYWDDRHQDHRLVSELTWNTWRNHLILEYEIPKYDGDFGTPNVFAPLTAAVLDRKIDLILAHFQTQANKHWLTSDLLRSVARIRGMECVASEHVAEAFYSRKVAF